MTPASTPKEVFRGLQSLSRVQLKLPDVTQPVQAEAVKQLHEQLPQLDTAGPADGWTLEFAFGVSYVIRPPMTASGGDIQWAPARACYYRLVWTGVVDGRFATAVAYEEQSFPGPARLLLMGVPPPLSAEGKQQLLLDTVARFTEAWREANPGPKQK